METSRLRAYMVVLLAAMLPVAEKSLSAHKPVTSKYEYNRDVFPLFRQHCGGCHLEGGPGPMSLMTYKSAMPWAQSIRDELTAGHMPPWPVDPTSPPVKGGHAISSHDINTIVVWASGGTPEGDAAIQLPALTFKPQWKIGPPDLQIPMETEHTLSPGVLEETRELSLPVSLSSVRWLKAADLMPGNASVVRDAIISIENGPVLALWSPGDEMVEAPATTAFRIEPGARLHLQIHYRKHFDQEQVAVSDKSTIGLYFTDAPPMQRELRSFSIDPPKPDDGRRGAQTFSAKLAASSRIVALRPMLDRVYESVTVEALTPAGMRTPLLILHRPQPQWPRRYWLNKPVALGTGAEIVVKATPLSDYSEEQRVTRTFPLQVFLDYVVNP